MVVNRTSSGRADDDGHPPVSTAQFQTLLETAHSHRLYPLLLLAQTTGLRRNELISLRWVDLDLTSGQRHVTAPPIRGRPGAAHTRVVTLTHQAATALKRWRDRQAREWLARGPFYHHDGYVFTDPHGRPYRPAHLARAVRNLIRGAGIHHANLHSLRALAMNQHPNNQRPERMK
jgi:integrase